MSQNAVEYDGSKPLKNPRDELFVQESIAQNSIHRGYEAAGFKRPRGNADRKAREPKIAKRFAYMWTLAAKGVEVMGGRHLLAQDRLAAANILDFWDVDDETGQLKKLNLSKVPHVMGSVIQEIGYDSKGRPKLKLHDSGAAQRFIIERASPRPQLIDASLKLSGKIESIYGLSDDELLAIARAGSTRTVAAPQGQD